MLNYKEVDESYFVNKTTQPILYLTHTHTHTHTPTPTQTHTHPHTHTHTHPHGGNIFLADSIK